MNIPIIGRVRSIRDKLFFQTRVSFDLLVSGKKVLLESSRRIETHIYVVVEVLEVHRSDSFEFCLVEYFI